MDEQRLLRACQLVDEGKYNDAYTAFIELSETTLDPIEKAWPLLYAANTLETLGHEAAAQAQLSAARNLIEGHRRATSVEDEKFAAAEAFLDFEDANLLWLRGRNQEAALHKFEAALKKHRSSFKDPRSRDLYDAIQIRRAFILANLGRWKDALPILEGIESPQEYSEGVAYYLGHCYLAAGDLRRAEQKLSEALTLGRLPDFLEYRAHFELGMTYYSLKNYSMAKTELEKGAQLAGPATTKEWQAWRWLELTCRALGLTAEAEQYARFANPS